MGSSVLQTNIGAQVVNVGASAKNVLTIDALPQLIEALLTAGCDQNCRGVPLPVVGVARSPRSGDRMPSQDSTGNVHPSIRLQPVIMLPAVFSACAGNSRSFFHPHRVPGAQWPTGAKENGNPWQACSRLARLICAPCSRKPRSSLDRPSAEVQRVKCFP